MARRATRVLMEGRLIYLMGPHGSGKDTVLQGLCRLMEPNGYLAPRLITRPATHTERGAISVSGTEFSRLERSGALAMAWRANGLAYGVPVEINRRLADGCDVLVNGSRAYLAEARRRYRTLVPVLLSVDQETLRQRLTARGRETDAQISGRLDRNARYARLTESTHGDAIMVLDNSGPAERAIQALYQYLASPTTCIQDNAADSAWNGQRPTSPRL